MKGSFRFIAIYVKDLNNLLFFVVLVQFLGVPLAIVLVVHVQIVWLVHIGQISVAGCVRFLAHPNSWFDSRKGAQPLRSHRTIQLWLIFRWLFAYQNFCTTGYCLKT